MPDLAARTRPVPRRLGKSPLPARIDRSWTQLSTRPAGDAEAERPLLEAVPQDRTPEAEGRARGQEAPRILIVDDEPSIRLVCRVNLALAGFETLEATDGEGALALARSERPNLILLDVMLPTIDGWEVASELRGDSATREIPIIFLTARGERADERRGYELGGLGYITKPFDPELVAGEVRSVLDRVGRGEAETLRAERLAPLVEPHDR